MRNYPNDKKFNLFAQESGVVARSFELGPDTLENLHQTLAILLEEVDGKRPRALTLVPALKDFCWEGADISSHCQDGGDFYWWMEEKSLEPGYEVGWYITDQLELTYEKST